MVQPRYYHMPIKVNRDRCSASTFFCGTGRRRHLLLLRTANIALVYLGQRCVLKLEPGLFEGLAQSLHLGIHRVDVVQQLVEGVGDGIGHVLRRAVGIEADLLGEGPAAVLRLVARRLIALHHAPRHAHHRGTRRHIFHYHCIGADTRAVAQGDGSQLLRARSHHDVIAQCRVSLALLPGRPAQGDAVIERAIVADLRRLADHHTHAVINEKAAADLGGGMELDAREPARESGDEAREPFESRVPELVTQAVIQHRVHTGIRRDDLERRARRRVTVEHDTDVFTQSLKHKSLSANNASLRRLFWRETRRRQRSVLLARKRVATPYRAKRGTVLIGCVPNGAVPRCSSLIGNILTSLLAPCMAPFGRIAAVHYWRNALISAGSHPHSGKQRFRAGGTPRRTHSSGIPRAGTSSRAVARR